MATLRVILHGFDRGNEIIRLGAPSYRLQEEVTMWPDLVRAKAAVPNDDLSPFDALRRRLDEQMDAIRKDYVDEPQG